jgi:hypothetical protein
MSRRAAISVFSYQRGTKSTIWSSISCGTQTPVKSSLSVFFATCSAISSRRTPSASGRRPWAEVPVCHTAPRSVPAPVDASLGSQLSFRRVALPLLLHAFAPYPGGGTLFHFQLNPNISILPTVAVLFFFIAGLLISLVSLAPSSASITWERIAFRRRPAVSFRLLTSCIAHDVRVRVRSRYDWTGGKTLHHADRERFVSISESQAATVRSLR